MNVKELLIKQSTVYPDKKVFFFKGRGMTFSQIKDISFRLANYLLALGLNQNSKIILYLPNIPEAMFSFLGAFSIGAAVVPLDFMLTENEIINFINHSEADILIAQAKKNISFNRIKNRCPLLKEILICGEKKEEKPFWGDVLESSSSREPKVDIDENKLAAILYTSGSTGHPKGVMLSFRHFDIPIDCMDYMLDTSEKDILLCGGVPFSHIGGVDCILVMLAAAHTLILMKRFQPLEFLRNIEKHRVTWFWIVPAMYVAILSLKDYAKFDLSSLRYAIVFGAPSSPALLRRFHKICPNAYLLNGWGMTETSAPNAVLPPGSNKIESVGKFVPWMEAKIVDEQGNSLGPNERGELWVKGEGVMLGYYKELELTQDVLTKDGWLKTGDIAYYDEEGLFYIVGRKKDMIKVAGEIVFAPEVEEKIHRHPKVEEVAVIGVADKLRGEAPKAFIVVKKGESLEEGELKEFLRKHLAHFKIPYYFEFVSELPKTRTGKIDKKILSTMWDVGRPT